MLYGLNLGLSISIVTDYFQGGGIFLVWLKSSLVSKVQTLLWSIHFSWLSNNPINIQSFCYIITIMEKNIH